MAGRSGHGRGRLRALPKKPSVDAVRNEINVTPLVDVCLVLLIIFMVITPMLARGKEVPLPETAFHADKTDHLQPVISIGRKSSQDPEIKLWLAGNSSEGKQELFEIGPVYMLEKEGTAEYKKMADQLRTEIKRFWEIAENVDAKGKLFVKVDHEVAYKHVYPLLMMLNADLSMSLIELGTAERKQ
jgi:biopolymer transport protein ExbD